MKSQSSPRSLQHLSIYSYLTNTIVFILQLQICVTQASIVTEKIHHYSILPSAQIKQELIDLQSQYPQFVRLSTTQEDFNLSPAGLNRHCVFDEDVKGCLNYYITIYDSIAHPQDSESYHTLPDVFLSGAVHGNERVGPSAVVEAAKLLLDAAYCESLPGIMPSKYNNDENEEEFDVNTEMGAEWLLQADKGRTCREELYKRDISDDQRQWLARLVTTRRIVILPTANALGYDQNRREENGVDPNRDFPFDVLDKTKCMQTIAGRSINELYRQSLFQISLTFHGGMEVIGYEWGAPTYSHKKSPDDIAQMEIGRGYSLFAGEFEGTKAYMSGVMNDLVYPVRGGMEDWAYAGSWDPNRVIQCKPNPTLNGPYSYEKTIYNNSTLRAFNMLIETSNDKIPKSHLGISKNVLDYKSSYQSNGHIARNIRLALMAVDIVEPYVSIKSLNGVRLSDDIVPAINRNGLECQNTKIMSISSQEKEATITWVVGGGFTVDFTNLFYAHWDDIPISIDCNTHPLHDELGSVFQSTPASNGITKWHTDSVNIGQNVTVFKASLDISQFKPGDKIAVFATARLDQGWTKQPENDITAPNLLPMSHIVNARTNDDYYHSSAGRIIHGRKDWFSIPLTIHVSKDVEEGQVSEVSNRFIIPYIPLHEEHHNDNNNDENSSVSPLVTIIALSIAVTFTMYKIVKRFVFIKPYSYAKRSLSMDDDNALDDEDTFDDNIQMQQFA